MMEVHTTTENNLGASNGAKDEPLFTIGEMVEVARRKMPGFNKDGGAARLTKVNDESELDKKMTDGSANGKKTTSFTYNVKYMLGGNERRVDARWIVSKDPEATSREDLKKERQESQQARQKAAAEAEAARAAAEAAEKEAKAAKRAAARDSSMLELQKRRKMIKERMAASKASAAAGAAQKKKKASAKRKRAEGGSGSGSGSGSKEVEDEEEEEEAVEEEPPKKQKVVNPRFEELQRCISAFTQRHKDEVLLEELRLALNKGTAGEEWGNSEIEEQLQQLEEENRVMYKAEHQVVWII
jgi:hypothetical protein